MDQRIVGPVDHRTSGSPDQRTGGQAERWISASHQQTSGSLDTSTSVPAAHRLLGPADQRLVGPADHLISGPAKQGPADLPIWENPPHQPHGKACGTREGNDSAQRSGAEPGACCSWPWTKDWRVSLVSLKLPARQQVPPQVGRASAGWPQSRSAHIGHFLQPLLLCPAPTCSRTWKRQCCQLSKQRSATDTASMLSGSLTSPSPSSR